MVRKATINHQRYTLSYWEANPEEHGAIVQEHLAQMSRGNDVWKEWVHKLSKPALVKKHGAAHVFVSNSVVDFSCEDFQFDLPVDFSGTVFDGEASFKNVKFRAATNFMRANFDCEITDFSSALFDEEVKFDNAVFNNDCEFMSAEFNGNASFHEVIFNGFAEFPDSKFRSDCYFNKSRFTGEATFSNCEFYADAYFSDIVFKSDTSFIESVFKAYADFGEVKFKNNIDFTYAEFEKASRFDDSVFSGETDFYSCKFEKAATFKNTKLSFTPEFNFSKFVQPPYLAHMEIPFQANKDESDIVHRHMKLKHMAIISNDHEQELRYFGYEMRAKGQLRKTAISHRFIIFLYRISSNFGQSIIRPVYAVLLYVGLMWLLNTMFITPDAEFCLTDGINERQAIAIYTVSSAVPVINLSNIEKSSISKCLFGDKKVLPIQHQLWKSLHLIPTTVFLFLFGLGVRNRFKIK